MIDKTKPHKLDKQGGKVEGNTYGMYSANYSSFLDKITYLTLRFNNCTGYPFSDEMRVARQHGIKQNAAITAMRESRRFCTAIENGNLFLSYGGRL